MFKPISASGRRRVISALAGVIAAVAILPAGAMAATDTFGSSLNHDPANAGTIYELVGLPWWPLQPGATEPNDVLSPVGRDGNLYKTTDNGANWHLILKGLPFGTQVHVQLVQGNEQMIYAGGVASPVPYMAGAPASNTNGADGSFDLQLSRDGGASWHAVPAIPRQGSMQMESPIGISRRRSTRTHMQQAKTSMLGRRSCHGTAS